MSQIENLKLYREVLIISNLKYLIDTRQDAGENNRNLQR